ncbi:sodium--glutamate symport carrier (gltS) [Thalassospira xiamenensis M-5 = DSM 17429]|nr:sodium--glutamate symport carrier (gltS) [Thalassospira xiamenensis M-5 = DSM 17429]
MALQNLVGMETARAFGLDPRAGLMVGSISLTGGVGTTLAWSDYFVETLGIAQAQELGLAANMIGLIAACTIGGPIASLLMRRHQLRASGDSTLEIGTLHSDEPHARLDYYGVLLALLWLNFALMLGSGINALVALSRMALFAHCVSLTLYAVSEPWNRHSDAVRHADILADVLKLDMATSGWKPTADNYLSRVPKNRILEAVTEALGTETAQRIDHLKKGGMVREAEQLLNDTGWVPEPLRTPELQSVAEDEPDDGPSEPVATAAE